MSDIVILDDSLKKEKLTSGKITIISPENAKIPVELMLSLMKKQIAIEFVKDITDDCEIAFLLGKIFKPGDRLVTSRPAFKRFGEYSSQKTTKTKAPKKEAAESAEKETVPKPEKPAEKSKKTIKEKADSTEVPGAMPKPISEAPEEKPVRKEPEKKFEKIDFSEKHENPDEKKFLDAYKKAKLPDKYKDAALGLFKLSTDVTSLKILQTSDLKGCPEDDVKKIDDIIMKLKGWG